MNRMTAAIIISSIAVLGAVAVAVKKFDENGQEMIDNLKDNIKEHVKRDREE